ncbi:Spo0E family sporulation regulatory protein-aspartic acid phosphatase [Brevibacillus sp. NPDC058079]|uniref:Spo0E family sporulation regulatory protein-aspartic acid phosphatase n=1 Tax=Brevibacillus sp. NPDC058079 TaxID=3346330 RepID=UPI0036F182E1
MNNKKKNQSTPENVPTSYDKKELHIKIEELRIELQKLASANGLADESVIKLSQELDKYIIQYQYLTRP